MEVDSSSTAKTADGQKESVYPLNVRVAKWFQTRGINPETLILTRVYSGKHLQDGDSWRVEPDLHGEVIAFPFILKGQEVNAKYRAAHKKFYQTPSGQKVFWNGDVIFDPALQTGEAALVITEGEIDALSFIEAGYPWAVSVPDGAPPPKDGAPEDLPEPISDTGYRYIHRMWAALSPIKRIIIATDNDEPGKRLAEELVRRLGRVRCLFVTYPEGCKDANDVLLKFGKEAVVNLVTEAKPYPLSGVYTYNELPAEPDLSPVTTGWGRLNDYIKLYYPSFMVVTGIANSGKSTWTNQLCSQLAIIHGWKIALASFEMRINPFISGTLKAVYKDHKPNGDATKWLDEHFVFIAPEPDDESDTFDIDWLIDKAAEAVIRHGIRIFVIDPWNEIEHATRKGESLTDYTGRAIRALKRFGRQYECTVIVVAHPTKGAAARVLAAKAKGEEDTITLYDVADSAHFANKADFGVVISRKDNSSETNVSIVKVRYQPDTGMIGNVWLTFKDGTFGQ